MIRGCTLLPKMATLRASDAAYREIKIWIQTGKVAPGHLIDDLAAMRELNMSRTPVREALLRLQAEGYIEVRRHKGIRVLPLSADDMRELYQVISALESSAVELIAERRPSEEDFAAIDNAIARMQEHQATKDVEKWGEADEAFHRELLRLSGNRRLLDVGCQMRDFAQRAHFTALRMQTDVYRANSTKSHAALVKVLRSPNPANAVEMHHAQRRRGEEALIGVVERFRLTAL
jgi:DNA-binding GntR family transcriptional regulator